VCRGLFAAPPAVATAPASAKPVPALTRYVDAHTHFEAKDPEGSVRSALAALSRQNAALILFQMPPDTAGGSPGPPIRRPPGQRLGTRPIR
jgi:uncharacterized membrane protein YgcG